MAKRWRNWAGNQTVIPREWKVAETTTQVREIVGAARQGGRRVKVIGSGHSFTSAAVADDVLVDVSRLDSVGIVDPATGEVEVGGGVTIAALNESLALQGRALANLGDIAYQTISGAISTSTHGTGVRVTGMAPQVSAVTIIDGLGQERRISESDGDHTLIRAAQVGVGALGVITSVRLRTVPAFVLHAVEEPAKLSAVLSGLDDLVDNNDHFEFFWMPHTDVALTKRNNRFDNPPRPLGRLHHWYQRSFLENTAFGGVCAVGKTVPSLIPTLAKVVAASGRLNYADQSHRIFASPRRVRFVEMEYAIPRDACASALTEVKQMIETRGVRVNFPIEVRFTAADDAMLSTAHGRESAYIAVHMYKGMEFDAYFRGVAEIMARYRGRPHWGKMHFLGCDELSELYPQWQDFQVVRRQLDPDGTFENDYVKRVFGPTR